MPRLCSICLVFAMFVAVGCFDATPAPQQTTKDKSKAMTRDELRAALVYKTDKEVLELLGRPERTREEDAMTADGLSLGRRNQYWYYREAARDPIADRLVNAVVKFEKWGDGKMKAVAVEFD